MNKANDQDREGLKELAIDPSQLPKAKGWLKPGATLYQGCWVRSHNLSNIVAFQQQFQAGNQDIILATYPKSGTTWLKALLFSVVNRARYTPSDTPLLTSNPHPLVPYLEQSPQTSYINTDGSHSSSLPRLFSTHVGHALLPESAVDKRSSNCRIVYVCRNPLDTIVSFWNYVTRGHPDWYGPGWTLEECIETFCKGESLLGPFWDHVLGFWNASREAPEKVLFLKYEDMKENTFSQVKKLAEFVGFPFSEDEEISGMVEQIIELCSLRSLKELDVNKHGKAPRRPEVENKIFFRKGEVGDWVNHLSPTMVESVKKVVEEKLYGSGLTFKYVL